MSHLRFNHVFFSLLALSFLSAFVISPKVTDKARAQVQGIFAPVARPVRWIATSIHRRVSPTVPRDDGSPNSPRSSAQLIAENTQLRVALANALVQVQALRQREAQLKPLGDIPSLCTWFKVIGDDSAYRKSFMINATSLSGVVVNDKVLAPDGLVGEISRVGVSGAQVKLITDTAMSITARVGRFTKNAQGQDVFESLGTDIFLFFGNGKNQLVASRQRDVVEHLGIRTDDWIVLEDNQWPRRLHGWRVGRVVSVRPAKAPEFIEIVAEPDFDPKNLGEVMVMNKDRS